MFELIFDASVSDVFRPICGVDGDIGILGPLFFYGLSFFFFLLFVFQVFGLSFLAYF